MSICILLCFVIFYCILCYTMLYYIDASRIICLCTIASFGIICEQIMTIHKFRIIWLCALYALFQQVLLLLVKHIPDIDTSFDLFVVVLYIILACFDATREKYSRYWRQRQNKIRGIYSSDTGSWTWA